MKIGNIILGVVCLVCLCIILFTLAQYDTTEEHTQNSIEIQPTEPQPPKQIPLDVTYTGTGNVVIEEEIYLSKGVYKINFDMPGDRYISVHACNEEHGCQLLAHGIGPVSLCQIETIYNSGMYKLDVQTANTEDTWKIRIRSEI